LIHPPPDFGLALELKQQAIGRLELLAQATHDAAALDGQAEFASGIDASEVVARTASAAQSVEVAAQLRLDTRELKAREATGLMQGECNRIGQRSPATPGCLAAHAAASLGVDDRVKVWHNQLTV
jgi:hypothetical protein